MEERSLPDFDKVREYLKGKEVEGIVLGEKSKEIGYGSQGRVYRFENKNAGQEGQPQFFAVKVMNYAAGKKEHRMYTRAQSGNHPSDHIVKILGHLMNKKDVCFSSSWQCFFHFTH